MNSRLHEIPRIGLRMTGRTPTPLSCCTSGRLVPLWGVTWALSVLEPAGLYLIKLPSADDVQEAKGLQTDVMAAKLKPREAANYYITHH